MGWDVDGCAGAGYPDKENSIDLIQNSTLKRRVYEIFDGWKCEELLPQVSRTQPIAAYLRHGGTMD